VRDRAGASSFRQFRRADGSVLQMTRQVSAQLLADWYYNRDRGVKRKDFADRTAKTGCRHGHLYFVGGGYWTAGTIIDKIKDAQQLARRDDDFAAEVAAFKEALAEIGGPEIGG
jgi:hypothetical protein